MRRLLGVSAWVVLAACWRGGTPPEPVVGNQSALVATPKDFTGAYWCSIASDGYQYDRFPCVIKRVNGRTVLAKLAGSQRVRGFIKPTGTGFRFDGELFCPWGDCTQPLEGDFRSTGGGYQATFAGGMAMRLERASPDAFGGASYGGDGYGDPFGFAGMSGGSTYGGQGYGGYTP